MASESHSGSAAPAPGDAREPHRALWSKLLLPLALLLGIAGALSFALLNGPSQAGAARRRAAAGAGEGFFGTLALPAKPAPPIELRNYLGQPVTLAQYRGRAVLVTFLYTNCPDVCPLITSNLRWR